MPSGMPRRRTGKGPPVTGGNKLRTSDFRSCRRHRVLPAAAPRMATAQPAERQAASSQGAVDSHRLDRVLGTTGREAAACQRPKRKSHSRG